jgi:N-formylglutamate deformylase
VIEDNCQISYGVPFMEAPFWRIEFGDGPLVAAALHDSSAVRPEVDRLLKLDESSRLYEEDPFTAAWTTIAPTRVIAMRSRFELDLNRPRGKAIYLSPADAWGLDVWKSPPPAAVVAGSLFAYDGFYAQVRGLLEQLLARHPRIVVFDLHSYNHRRDGRDGPPADPKNKPEINLGTRSLDRAFWAPVVDSWHEAVCDYNYLGRRLDVRENVCFFGGHFPRWVHGEFPRRACVLAIEVKKFFMDEWSGELDVAQHRAVHDALAAGSAAVKGALQNWRCD